MKKELEPRYAVVVHNVNEEVQTIFGEDIEEEYWDFEILSEHENIEEAVRECNELTEKHRWLMREVEDTGDINHWFSVELRLGEHMFTLAYSPGLEWNMDRVKDKAMDSWLSWLGLTEPQQVH